MTTPAATAPAAPPTSAESWSIDNLRWLTLALRRLRLRLHRQSALRGGAPPTLGWLIAVEDDGRAGWADDVGESSVVERLDDAIATRGAELAELQVRMAGATGPAALPSLAAALGLTPLESELLLLAAAPALDGAFGVAFAELHADDRRDRATMHLALLLLTEPGPDRLLAFDALMPDAALRQQRLIELGGSEREQLSLRPFVVDDRMADFLRGVNRMDARLVPLLTRVSGSPSPSGGVADRAADRVFERLSRSAEGPPFVNLLAQPGAAAPEVAQRACTRLGQTLFELRLPRLAEYAADERTLAAELFGREALLAGLALFVDARGIDA